MFGFRVRGQGQSLGSGLGFRVRGRITLGMVIKLNSELMSKIRKPKDTILQIQFKNLECIFTDFE